MAPPQFLISLSPFLLFLFLPPPLESSMEALPVAKCLLYVAAGKALAASDVLTRSDGEGRLAAWTYSAALAGAVYSAGCLGISWLLFGRRQARERAVLMGCSVGSSATLFALPFVEQVLGTPGLQAAILFGLANSIAAAPEKYLHRDSGVYRGQWEGLKKEGLGTYRYPSGAVYEGEWKDNQKSGRGIYTFPKGGLYEGEWLNGVREGVGVRTFSNGKVTAGRWHDNNLKADLEVWQCAKAVEGAADAADAARKVDVGGGTIGDATENLILQPAVWATLLSIGVNLLDVTLPPSMDAMTRPLAAAHGPLALMAAGLTLELLVPAYKQVHNVVAVLGMRCITALLLCSGLLSISSARFPVGVIAGTALLISALSPISMQACSYARKFRLNEKLTASLVSMSSITSLILMPMAALASIALRATVHHSAFGPILARVSAATAVVVLLASVALEFWFRPKKPVKMVFRAAKIPPPNGGETSGTADLSTFDGPGSEQGRGSQLSALPPTFIRREKRVHRLSITQTSRKYTTKWHLRGLGCGCKSMGRGFVLKFL